MRRANVQRINEVKLAGLRGGILREWRQSEDRADEILLEWETEASTRGLDRAEPAYWDQAATWIAGRVRPTM